MLRCLLERFQPLFSQGRAMSTLVLRRLGLVSQQKQPGQQQPQHRASSVALKSASLSGGDVRGAYTYGELSAQARLYASRMSGWLSSSTSSSTPGCTPSTNNAQGTASDGLPVGILAPSCAEFAAALTGVWAAGHIAVPLQPAHPLGELEYIVNTLSMRHAWVHPACKDQAAALAKACPGLQVHAMPCTAAAAADGRISSSGSGSGSGASGLGGAGDAGSAEVAPLPASIADSQAALVIFTSGTTSKPKGCVTTHAALNAQVGLIGSAHSSALRILVQLDAPSTAQQYTSDEHRATPFHSTPLHHRTLEINNRNTHAHESVDARARADERTVERTHARAHARAGGRPTRSKRC